MKFTLKSPVEITSRLMAGVRVGGATISIEYGGATHDGRRKYHYFIDLPDGTEHNADDLASGVGGGSLQSGLESLLSFLSACGESYRFEQFHKFGSESELFPSAVAEWAAQNSDELSMIAIELEETPDCIRED